MDKIEYSERPHFHFTAPEGWTNDPNGTVFYAGEYHLFYQHHPHSLVWGPMHWGHAVSKDLLNWEHLPIALYPDELGMIFSGSSVVDYSNSSGFGTSDCPAMVVAYTSHSDQGEKQSIAYSTDSGRTWSKYDGSPVVSEQGIKDFRDPRVFFHIPSQHWVMVVASGDRAWFYTSTDLRSWCFTTEFGPIASLTGAIWECPDLFELPYEEGTKWVLSLSLSSREVGDSVIYFTGDFNGNQFGNDGEPLKAEFGSDFYAPITFSGAPGRTVWIGWMNNWAYADKIPAKTWRGMMSLPRELRLVNAQGHAVLHQSPVPEFLALPRQNVYTANELSLAMDGHIDTWECGKTFEILGEMEKGAGKLFIKIFGCIIIVFDTCCCKAAIQRISGANNCGHPLFAGKTMEVPFECTDWIDFSIYVDDRAVEVFAGDGRIVFSSLVFPLDNSGVVTIYSELEKCTVKHLEINKI